MTLTEFLTARLDEDEATAHYAGPHIVAWLTFRGSAGEMLYTTVAAGDEGDERVWAADGNELPEPASVRVVYDPARALRDVAAKRAIFAEHERLRSIARSFAPDDGPMSTGRVQAMRTALSILAAVYSDHPDYDPEWKP